MNNQNSRALALSLTFGLLLVIAQPRAHAEVPIQFTPPHEPSGWDTTLAQTVIAATQVMVAQMDMGEVEVRAWVARVPGDPPPAGLFDDMAWPHELASGYALELDLGESLTATAEMIGEDFEARYGQGWTARALALADTASGRPLVRQEYNLMPDDGMGSLGISVHAPFVDLQRLEILEGTWIQIVRISGADL